VLDRFSFPSAWYVGELDRMAESDGKRMPERPPPQELSLLRERAANLRELAAKAMPQSIAGQLLDVAAELERRATRSELLSHPDNEARNGCVDSEDANEGTLEGGAEMAPREVGEREWIRRRISQLRDLIKFVTDDRAIAAIESLIDDAESRLERLERSK
jgi:hypothetical protein